MYIVLNIFVWLFLEFLILRISNSCFIEIRKKSQRNTVISSLVLEYLLFGYSTSREGRPKFVALN